jgi:ribosomal protein RSM22 (predicted rRNA methylase)
MQLPRELSAKIAELGAGVPSAEQKQAARLVSENYREPDAMVPLRGRAQQLAYLSVRLPATFAAVRRALGSAAEALPGWSPASLLDLGAGPGTTLWAACEVFPSLEKLYAVERDPALLALGRELAQTSPQPALQNATWSAIDLQSWRPGERYQLTVASYSFGELAPAVRKRVLLAAWQACDGALVVVEPGTRRGFETIAGIRDFLIGAGATLAAPCPHARDCPMHAAGDWCHFSVRVERTAEHRRLKQGELGHEDEKFSYIVACKVPSHPAASRIVRHPLRYSGHTKLLLCTPDGLKQETVTRSQKERYRAAKRSDWGSRWNPR